MKLICGYIYSPARYEQPKSRFIICVLISVLLHVGFLAWSFYESVIAPFTEIRIVDADYTVNWVEIKKPLKYPPSVFPLRALPPSNIKLEKIARSRAKPDEPEKKNEEPKKNEEDKPEHEESQEVNQEAEQKEVAKEPPRFGLINARPIREIVGRVYSVYKSGGLDLKEAIFSIKLGFEIAEDGSLRHVEILESSGSEQIDAAALNIASAIGASNALMPLAVLSSSTATLVLTHSDVSLEIAGTVPSERQASELASNFSQQLAGLRFLMSLRNKDAAEILSHMSVFNTRNQLVAKLKMSRADASALMQKNFTVVPQAPTVLNEVEPVEVP
ncbi:MAG: hypothetical protein RMM17_07430 [Acidobacteriota bacterium]|nr:hypothetical protein [Blastocatellia bacterium]MDW8412497.1 hypothetical protein [Acidobacteriota bacterium]